MMTQSNFRHIQDIQSDLIYSGWLSYITSKKHCICVAHFKLLNIYCIKNNIEPELFSNMWCATFRIIRNMDSPLIVNFEILKTLFENTIKNWTKPKESYYLEIEYDVDISEAVVEYYLKEVEFYSKRNVLFEKSWDYHIGSERYWNKKLITLY